MSQSTSQSRRRSLDTTTLSSSVTGKKSKKTTPPYYSREFEQKLIDIGIYPYGYVDADGHRQKPTNINDLRKALAKRRPSMSSSTSLNTAFLQFKRDNHRARSESKVMAEVIPAITGLKDKEHESVGDVVFNRLEKFDKDIPAPKPNRYYGAKPAQIDLRVRRDLSKYITPSNRTSLPAAPNFFLESENADARSEIAQRQAMHNGAIGARGMLYLQNYGIPSLTYDRNAYTITSTYHPSAGALMMFATHPTQSEGYGGRTEYHMNQLNTYAMTGNMNSFREGAAAYRNARDLMRQERDRFIANANAVAQGRSVETASLSRSRSTQASVDNDEDSPDSDTSMDELAPEYQATKPQQQHQSTCHIV